MKRNSELPSMLVLAIEEMKKAENLKRAILAFTELSHYSQSHLSRLIKKFFNMSLKQYINELRLQTAYHDLILTNRSAEKIAENLGFSSFSHFNKIFKARFSITPSALRKAMEFGRFDPIKQNQKVKFTQGIYFVKTTQRIKHRFWYPP